LIDLLYNCNKNGGTYEVTFLEFGSTGCPTCKRMESLIEEIKAKFPQKVNVFFLNILRDCFEISRRENRWVERSDFK